MALPGNVTAQPYDGDPADIFFVPGVDAGLYLLGPLGPQWQTIPDGRFDTFCISEQPQIHRRLRNHLGTSRKERGFSAPIRYNSVPVVVEKFAIIDGHQNINGKWFLSGAAGERVFGHAFRNWRRSHGGDASDWTKLSAAHFAEASAQATAPEHWAQGISGLDFVIDARSLTNYYHFSKEVMASIAVIAELAAFDGDVVIVCKKADVPGFVTDYLDFLFPEFRGRIRFVKDPQYFERALTVWHTELSYFQSAADRITDLIPPENQIAQKGLGPSLGKTIRFNGYSRSLDALRERAWAQADIKSSAFPRRFWVARRERADHRGRGIKGIERLTSALAAKGFETVYFEDMRPAEQVQIMANAEVMISYHGAGFTNMNYAAPATQVIELGTLQTAVLRWSDFAPFARSSGCHYTNIVADYEHAGEQIIPPMRGHGLYPVRITDDGVDQMIALVERVIG